MLGVGNWCACVHPFHPYRPHSFPSTVVVADKDVQQASTEIMESLPYKICFYEFIFFNPNRPTLFPHSVHLPKTNASTITIQNWLSSILSRNCTSTFTTRAARYPFLHFRTLFDSQRELLSLTRWLRSDWTLLLVKYIPRWRIYWQCGCRIFYLHSAELSTGTPKWRIRTGKCGSFTEYSARKSAILWVPLTWWIRWRRQDRVCNAP